MSEPLEEEEKQRIRVELMAEIARNEQDPEQCKEETGRYNREIFYNVRDLEQLCSITECPLTPDQIMEFKLCRLLPTTRCMKAYGHRGAKQRAKVAKIEQDLEQCNEETGWYNREFLFTLRDLQKMYTIKCPVKAELKKFGIWSSEERGKYDPEKQLLIRQVRALLNKIRLISDGDTTTEKSLTKEFLDFELYQSPALKGIVWKIVDMAVKEPILGERLAKLSQYQRIAELRTTGKAASAFGDALLSCIDELDKGGETDEKKQIDSPESLRKLGSRKFGSVMFIGHLVLCGFIPFNTFANCVIHPFKSTVIDRYDEDSIESVIRLLVIIDGRVQKGLTAMLEQTCNFFFDILDEFRKHLPVVSERTSNMFDELIRKNSNGWKRAKIGNMREVLYKIQLISDGDTTTEESLTKEFLDYEVYKTPALRWAVSMIVELAVNVPKLCEILSRLCKSQVEDEVRTNKEDKSAFRDMLFHILDKVLDFKKEEKPETDEKKQIDSPESLNKLSRKFGSVNFIGHLYVHDLVPVFTLLHWLCYPFALVTENTPDQLDEESVECALRLMAQIGAKLHEFMPAAVRFVAPLSAKRDALKAVTDYFYRNPFGIVPVYWHSFPFEIILREMHRVKPIVSSRIRFMIEDVEEQRANGWKPRKSVEEGESDERANRRTHKKKENRRRR